jgi:DNA-binding PucR family transcriptional regulator
MTARPDLHQLHVDPSAAIERTGVEPLKRLPGPTLEGIGATVAALRAQIDEVAALVAAYCHLHIPELGDDDEHVGITQATARANMELIFWAVDGLHAPREIDPPHEAIEFARRYAREGLPLDVLLRQYRLGHAFFWHTWAATLSDQLPDDSGEALDAASVFLFAYIDSVCARLAEVHTVERLRWDRSTNARQLRTVREVLAGDLTDEVQASQRLSWRLDRRQIAIIGWWRADPDPGDVDADALERALDDLRRELRTTALTIWADDGRLWAWVASDADDLSAGRLEELIALPASAQATVGEPGAGLAGFRRSHEQAAAAARVVQLAEQPRALSTYRGVALESLMLGDIAAVRRFIDEQLGGLAGPGASRARLRKTLEEFLDARQSPSQTAARLGLHKNTVIYRLSRAGELRGRPLDEDRLELGAALRLYRVLEAVPG